MKYVLLIIGLVMIGLVSLLLVENRGSGTFTRFHAQCHAAGGTTAVTFHGSSAGSYVCVKDEESIKL